MPRAEGRLVYLVYLVFILVYLVLVYLGFYSYDDLLIGLKRAFKDRGIGCLFHSQHPKDLSYNLYRLPRSYMPSEIPSHWAQQPCKLEQCNL